VRLHNQLEALLEETRMKLSSVLSDLLGQSGRRILQALAEGHTDPVQLAALGDDRLKCSKEELADALRGQFEPIHRQLLQMFLERLAVLDRHLQRFDELIGEALQEHAQAVIRLAEIPGFGPDSAQQLIAEIGPEVKAFPSAGEFAAWIGICPGSDESAEQNRSSHSPKGNPFVRRLFTQAAQAAVKKQGSHFQSVFRRWLPRLHYQGAIWAVGHKLARLVWKILHDRVHYIEQGEEPNPRAKKRRAQKMVQALRRMGYKVEISPLTPAPAAAQA
jgi:transposase